MYFLNLLSFRDESFFLSSAEMAALWTATPAGPPEPDAGAGALALVLALLDLLTGGFLLGGFLPVLRDWDGPPPPRRSWRSIILLQRQVRGLSSNRERPR